MLERAWVSLVVVSFSCWKVLVVLLLLLLLMVSVVGDCVAMEVVVLWYELLVSLG